MKLVETPEKRLVVKNVKKRTTGKWDHRGLIMTEGMIYQQKKKSTLIIGTTLLVSAVEFLFFFLLTTVRKCEIHCMQYLLPHPCQAMVPFASAEWLYFALMGDVPRLISAR